MQLYVVVLYGVNYRIYCGTGGWITYDSYSTPPRLGSNMFPHVLLVNIPPRHDDNRHMYQSG